MMNHKVAKLISYPIVAVLLATSITLSGCNPKGLTIQKLGNGYNSLTIENELVYYSVEYPAFYSVPRWAPEVDYQSFPLTYVMFLAPKSHVNIVVPNPGKNKVETVRAEYVPAWIEIGAHDPSSRKDLSQNSTEFLDDLVADMSRHESTKFKLLKRSPVTVSGITGERIIYEWDGRVLAPRDEPLRLYRVQKVIFDFDGLIWAIEAEARTEDLVDEVNTYFEHVLQTFKILGTPNSQRQPSS
jgi:hypothetical protein